MRWVPEVSIGTFIDLPGGGGGGKDWGVKTAARCGGVPGALSHSQTQCTACEVTTGSEVRVPDPSSELTEM